MQLIGMLSALCFMSLCSVDPRLWLKLHMKSFKWLFNKKSCFQETVTKVLRALLSIFVKKISRNDGAIFMQDLPKLRLIDSLKGLIGIDCIMVNFLMKKSHSYRCQHHQRKHLRMKSFLKKRHMKIWMNFKMSNSSHLLK